MARRILETDPAPIAVKGRAGNAAQRCFERQSAIRNETSSARLVSHPWQSLPSRARRCLSPSVRMPLTMATLDAALVGGQLTKERLL